MGCIGAIRPKQEISRGTETFGASHYLRPATRRSGIAESSPVAASNSFSPSTWKVLLGCASLIPSSSNVRKMARLIACWTSI